MHTHTQSQAALEALLIGVVAASRTSSAEGSQAHSQHGSHEGHHAGEQHAHTGLGVWQTVRIIDREQESKEHE
jgi:hypothetical protein